MDSINITKEKKLTEIQKTEQNNIISQAPLVQAPLVQAPRQLEEIGKNISQKKENKVEEYSAKNYLSRYTSYGENYEKINKYKDYAKESNPYASQLVNKDDPNSRKESERRKKFSSAASYYEKANKVLDKKVKPLMANYQCADARLEALDLRLKGMRYAAEASASDKTDEQIRKSKAESKIIQAKLDLIAEVEEEYKEWLSDPEEGFMDSDSLIKTYNKLSVLKPRLIKQLEKENSEMKKQFSNTVKSWKEKNLELAGKRNNECFDEESADVLFQIATNQGTKSKLFLKYENELKGKKTSEGYKIAAGDGSRVFAACMKGYMAYPNGKPVSPEDCEKFEWNKRWMKNFTDEIKGEEEKEKIQKKSEKENWTEAKKDKKIKEVQEKQNAILMERQEMYKAYLDEMMKHPLPSPEELTKDPEGFFKANMEWVIEMDNVVVSVSNLEHSLPSMKNCIAELSKDKRYKTYLDLATVFTSIKTDTLAAMGIIPGNETENVYLKGGSTAYMINKNIKKEDTNPLDSIELYATLYADYLKAKNS